MTPEQARIHDAIVAGTRVGRGAVAGLVDQPRTGRGLQPSETMWLTILGFSFLPERRSLAIRLQG